MKVTNQSLRGKRLDGVWFEPGETKEEVDIREDLVTENRHFKLEDESASETEPVEADAEDESEDEESSKSEEKNNNEGE